MRFRRKADQIIDRAHSRISNAEMMVDHSFTEASRKAALDELQKPMERTMQTTIPCAVPTTNASAPVGKPEPDAKKSTGNSAVDTANAELPDLPSALKVPAADRKAAWKGRKSTKPKADKLEGDLTLPRNIEPGGREILKQQEQIKKESKEARLRALRENKTNRVPKSHSADLKPPESCPDELIKKIDKVICEVKEKKRRNSTSLPADPKKREAAVDKLARKEVPAKKKPQPAAAKDGKTIGGVARAAILAGKDNEGALAAVMKAFPKCNSNLGCMNWYRNDLRKKGELKSPKKVMR